jgi:hypothetical protein
MAGAARRAAPAIGQVEFPASSGDAFELPDTFRERAARERFGREESFIV